MQVIVTHDVDDVEHWYQSPKRGEFFGARGMTATAFRAPEGDGQNVAVLIECPDMETLQESLTTPEAAAAMKHDGVHAETVHMFVAG